MNKYLYLGDVKYKKGELVSFKSAQVMNRDGVLDALGLSGEYCRFCADNMDLWNQDEEFFNLHKNIGSTVIINIGDRRDSISSIMHANLIDTLLIGYFSNNESA